MRVTRLLGCLVAGKAATLAEQPRNRATKQPWIALLITIVLLAAPALQACPVCYGDPNSPMAKSADNGVLFLLGVIGFVQVGFIGLFASFWRRSRALRRRRESFRVLDGGGQ